MFTQKDGFFMNTSSLLVYFLTYFFLTLLLFVLFRKRIIQHNSLRYLFLSCALIGAVAPFLCILFGPWFTVALLACLSIGLSAFFVFYTLREERKAQTEDEDFVTDIETLPSHTETFYEEESSIEGELFHKDEIPALTEMQDDQKTFEIQQAIVAMEEIHDDEPFVPDLAIHPQSKSKLPTADANELFAFAPDGELKPLKWDEEESINTAAADPPYTLIDKDEMINTEIKEYEIIDDEPVLYINSSAEFRFEGDDRPLYPNEEAAAKEKPEQKTITDEDRKEDQEEEKDYYAYLEEVLEEEGLANADKTKH
jgi:hypothetical protein